MLILEAEHRAREGERDDAEREKKHPELGGTAADRCVIGRLAAQCGRRHRQAAHALALAVGDLVGVACGLALGVAVAVGVAAGAVAGSWAAVNPNSLAGAQAAASGAAGLRPGLSAAGTGGLCLALDLLNASSSAWYLTFLACQVASALHCPSQ